MEGTEPQLAEDPSASASAGDLRRGRCRVVRPTNPNRDAALAFTVGTELLPIDEEVLALGQLLIDQRVMPGPLKGDAIHVAVAAYHGMDYLLSWNVKHLANPNKRIHLQRILMNAGKGVPAIVTPEVLWEEDDHS